VISAEVRRSPASTRFIKVSGSNAVSMFVYRAG
jgi:hypothetical protein